MTRLDFDQRLIAVNNSLHEMKEVVCHMILDAVEGAVERRDDLLHAVINRDEQLDRLEETTIREIFQLIVMQAPVGSDARVLTSSFAVANELELAGDDAVKLARRASKISDGLSDDLQAPLGALAESVVQMLSDAMELYNEYRPEIAQNIIDSDEMIDNAYKRARNRILEVADTQQHFSREIFRTIEIFHALEHVADRAVQIAKHLRTIYSRPETS